MTRMEHFRDIINIVLSEDNRPHFEAVIDSAKRAYIAETEKREKEIVEGVWDVSERLAFGETFIETEMKKSVMEPFFSDERWRSEKAFIDFLERPRNKVLWWFKNGDQDATFFAVPYSNGEEKLFYVDFIVKFKDGRVGLFDPHGAHLSDFKAKADGLYQYIQGENKKGKNLFGGIVANTDQRNYRGRWIYFGKRSKELKDNDFSDWENLEL